MFVKIGGLKVSKKAYNIRKLNDLSSSQANLQASEAKIKSWQSSLFTVIQYVVSWSL